MTKNTPALQTLINTLCPNGVEYKTIGEISEYRRGSFPQPYGNLEWYGGEGAMPFVQVVDVGDNMLLLKDTKKKISKLAQPKSVFVPKGTVIVTLQGSIGRVAVTQYDSYVDRTLGIFEKFKIEINKKYFAYQLESKFNIEKETARGSTIKTITKEEFTKFKIPIPPLKIQEEIVRILDKFTKLETELRMELEMESKKRKKQYDYYRECLFNKKDFEYKTLGDVGEFIRGNGLQKKDFTETGVGCIHYGQIYTYYGTFTNKTKSFVSFELSKKLKKVHTGDVVVTNTSENLEDVGKAVVWCGDEDIVTGGHATIFKPHEINGKYFAYYTQTQMFFNEKRKYAKGTKVIDVSAKDMIKIKIPLPLISEQERIVKILDKLASLNKDILINLSTEIKARRLQYEYYRNKLLTFKEYAE